MTIDNKPYRRLTARRLCERYDVVVRTIDRWLEQGILPPPLIINGRRYWDEEEIERSERERMTRRNAAANNPPSPSPIG
jgi:predicted site-specific integrase-resolvase